MDRLAVSRGAYCSVPQRVKAMPFIGQNIGSFMLGFHILPPSSLPQYHKGQGLESMSLPGDSMGGLSCAFPTPAPMSGCLMGWDQGGVWLHTVSEGTISAAPEPFLLHMYPCSWSSRSTALLCTLFCTTNMYQVLLSDSFSGMHPLRGPSHPWGT